MKTIFKEGMEVWDKIISPNKGKVIEVLEDTNFDFTIKVEFDDGLKIQYTNEGCFVKSKGAIKTLSTADYSIDFEGFEQKAPPKTTYEEALEWLEKNSKDSVIYADEAYVNEEYEFAFEALRKLIILRDYYNEGWQPDWNDNATKYSIEVEVGEIVGRNHHCNARIMSFKTNDVRNKFLEEQRELLEIAKPLL
jgi:hypothetical protein